MRRQSWLPPFLMLPLLLVACDEKTTGPDPDPEPGQPPTAEAVARLEIVPGSLLLPGEGATARLTARAFDAAGNPTTAAVTWRSSDGEMVSVSADGVALAEAPAGSARITAEADGVLSAPVLALVAGVAGTTTLVADTQVVGDPEPVDAGAEYGLGWRYRVRLNGMETGPEVGEILLGTGEVPVGGRVVAATQSGEEVVVTLELVPLEEMFEELVIDEVFDLSQAEITVPDEVSAHFDVQRLPGGAVELRRRTRDAMVSTPASPARPGAPRVQSTLAQDLLEVDLGPFRCKFQVAANPLRITGETSFTITPDLDFILDYDSNAGGLQRLLLEGEVQAEIGAEPQFETSFENTVNCQARLAQVALPIGGPVALIFGGQVPLGVGFEAKGRLTFGNAGLRFDVESHANAAIGIDCTGACEMVNTFDSGAEGFFEPVFPSDLAGQFRVDVRLFPYGFAKLSIGNPFLRALQFESFEIRAGLAQLLDMATTHAQADDPGYASGFRLSIYGLAKAGAQIDALLGMLQIGLAKVEAEVEVPVATSPAGTFAISPGSVRSGNDSELGELATFTVELDPVTYLGFDAVDAVELRWKRDDGNGGYTLENARPGCTSMNAAPGQTTFTCQADFLEEHEGEQTFYAFVHARLFGVPVVAPLEIAGDGMASVHVSREGVTVAIEPRRDTLFTGATRQFSASVTGAVDTSVSWSATGGTITADGLYTVGDQPGAYEVTARSAADSAVSATARVLVRQAPEFVPERLRAHVCDSPLLESVDDLPFSISGTATQPNYPEVTCSASASLAVTPQADGTILIEGTLGASGNWGLAGGSWLFRFDVSGPYEYEFDARWDGDHRGLVAFWAGHRDTPTYNSATPILACAGLSSGISGYECPPEEVATGIIDDPSEHTWDYAIRADVSAGGEMALTFKLTLKPVL